MIQQTVYVDSETTRKQLTMPVYGYEALKEGNDDSMTKGLRAYEALLFADDNLSDSLSDIENHVDDRLVSLTDTDFRNSVHNTQFNIGLTEQGDSETNDHVNIHLPKTVLRQLTIQRGIGHKIAEAMDELERSPFDDRFDRIDCKKELIRHFEDGRRSVENDIAEAIIKGEFEDVYTHYVRVSDDVDWWDSEDLDFGDLNERDATEIPKGKQRVDAFSTVVANSQMEGPIKKSQLEDKIESKYDDVSQMTVSRYADQVKIETYKYEIEVAFDDIAKGVCDGVFGDRSDYLNVGEDMLETVQLPKHEMVDHIDSMLRTSIFNTGVVEDEQREEDLDTFHTFIQAIMNLIENDMEPQNSNQKHVKGLSAVQAFK